jgi:hypothetical protein
MSSGTTDNYITVGVFADEVHARQAVRNLEAKGFESSQLHVIADTENQKNEPGDVSDNAITRSNYGLVAGGLIGLVAGILLGTVLSSGLVNLPPFLHDLGTFGVFILVALVCIALGILLGSMSGLGMTREGTVGLIKQVEAGRWLLSIENADIEQARTALKQAGALELRVQSDKPEPIQ